MLTDKQLQKRQYNVGASDIESLFEDEYRLWLEKTGKLEPEPATDAMVAGQLLEPTVIAWAETKLGKIKRGGERRLKGTLLLVHLDGITGDGIPVEAKTAGICGGYPVGWGEPDTDEVPERIILQVHGQMMATNTDMVYVPALIGGKGFCMYHVKRDKEIIDMITERIEQFEKRVRDNIPPEQIKISLDVARRIRRVPEKTTRITAKELVEQFEAYKETESEAKKEKERVQAQILAMMGDAELAYLDDMPDKVCTYFGTDRKGYVVKPGVRHNFYVKPADKFQEK